MTAKPIKSLADWMEATNTKDADLAPKLSISRVQVSRLRRGVNGASVKTAHRLEELTGLPWHNFLNEAIL